MELFKVHKLAKLLTSQHQTLPLKTGCQSLTNHFGANQVTPSKNELLQGAFLLIIGMMVPPPCCPKLQNKLRSAAIKI